MSDPVDVPTPAEPATVEAPAPHRTPRKAGGKKAAKRPASTPASRTAAAAQIKVGAFSITLPASLASSLTGKDKKKLSALFKRAVKRQKKDALKKDAAKKGAAKKAAARKAADRKRAAKKR